MFQLTDVVKHLLIINLIVFFGALLMERVGVMNPAILACYYPQSVYFQPFQIVTHMFMHGGFFHLFFNMFGLVMFGPHVESFLGPRRFLTMYLVAGFGALFLHMFIWHLQVQGLPPALFNEFMQDPSKGVVGASGALYGVLAAFALLFPNVRLMLLFPPIPIKAKFLVLGLVAYDLFSGLSGFQGNIAHFAHVGGALFGFLMLMFWRGRARRR